MSALVFSLGACAAPDGPSGAVRVVDADTIDVGGTRIRLHAIDAPELTQTCANTGGDAFDCGAWSAAQVAARFGGRMAACEALGTDRNGRMVARCAVDGADMGAEIVARGWAFAYRRYGTDYVEVEEQAAAQNVGLHSVSVRAPEDFRRARHADGTPPRAACAIKGNISRSGRVYHMPGQIYYDRTGINTERGERWFCSEAEARAAGWRPAQL